MYLRTDVYRIFLFIVHAINGPGLSMISLGPFIYCTKQFWGKEVRKLHNIITRVLYVDSQNFLQTDEFCDSSIDKQTDKFVQTGVMSLPELA